MSRTIGDQHNFVGLYKSNRGKDGIIGRKILMIKRRLKPYVSHRNQYGKYSYQETSDIAFSLKTKALKLELKNANRSFKKSMRQSAKRDIKEQLN